MVLTFPLSTGNTLFGQICSKKSKLFKVKFGTLTNSSMQNSLMMLTFLFFWPEIKFLGKFGPKNQNCQFRLKFGTQSDSNLQNLIVKFAFSVFNWIYPFWANLVQKIKIVSFSCILVPRLIRICRVECWFPFFLCVFFCCRSDLPFLAKFAPKNHVCEFKLKVNSVQSLIRICRIQC